MKINRSCETCEFCFHENGKRICASAYYGKEMTDLTTQKNCWEISLEYWLELQNKLSKEEYAILNDFVPLSYKRKAYKDAGVKNDTEYLIKITSAKE